MKAVYDIAIFSFPTLLRLISPFHKKARLMIKGRANWENKLISQDLQGKKIWFHCASLGEFEQGRPLIERLKKQYSSISVVVTFFSSSGYEVQKNYDLAAYVCYLPFDGRKTSAKFVELLDPDLVVFIKYEFWYYYLSSLKRKQIPVISVSAIFRPDQQFFKKRQNLFNEMLSFFNHFFVQNEQSKSLLNNQGIQNVTVSGDTRFDRVIEICRNPAEIDTVKQFKGDQKIMVIGSSWPEDIDVLLPLLNDPTNELKFIIAPHEVEEAKIHRLCQEINTNFQLFSTVDPESIHLSKILIIDSIGLLSSLYQYGELAYIGGAFGDGLHNILEAATFGMPVLFGKGKDNVKYQEAVDLVKMGGAFEVSNSDELKDKVEQILINEELLEKASGISKDYVHRHAGATDVIMNYLHKFLDS